VQELVGQRGEGTNFQDSTVYMCKSSIISHDIVLFNIKLWHGFAIGVGQ
jgi:hypothetical protein